MVADPCLVAPVIIALGQFGHEGPLRPDCTARELTGSKRTQAPTHPNLHLEVSFTNFPGSEQLGRLDFDALAPHRDRLLFGSDFPNLTFTYADQADAWWKLAMEHLICTIRVSIL